MATDWAVEVFKVAGTGLSVFIGARLAFRYAETGRRNDVYYKERFKAYMTAAGVLTGMSMSVNEILETLEQIVEGGNAAEATTDEVRGIFKENIDEMYAYVNHESYVATMILSEKARTEYLRLIHLIRPSLAKLAQITDRNSMSNQDKLNIINEVITDFTSFRDDADTWTKLYILELDIPNVSNIVGSENRQPQL